ncbi:MAG TPA: polysaccharide biosynthesis tyrosine autokinase [Candidatus Aminicenantes bacterium]|nr:polysaccharide biosynthesis tyrosine autokinase [Candidatus Aminicenantes bacterium]HRY65730.1 polysaccharide biosynthesis tyrosine autokinase [Candidatus Aminicenantes bacterium]HRZ72644.1 polysaccharide biosynthesis tyrosine autokinase [Candidatus Aminicenantes bacterium]
MKNGNEIQLADYEIAEPQQINLRDYWDRLMRRKGTVLAVTLGVFILGAFWTFIQKPVYTAKSQLLVEKEPNILSFEQVLQIESMRDDFYQTQYRLLSGRGLADTVIERLKLYGNPEFVGKPETRKKPVDPADHVFREGLIDDFLARLTVKPVRLTRLVDVSFGARDPRLAADCVNELTAAFIDLNINMKYAATEQATTFLTEQIKGLQAEIERKSKELQGYEAEANIVALSDSETTVIDRLSQLNKALTEAQIERSQKEATWNGLKNVSPDYVPEAFTNPLIQRLREEYVRLKRETQKMEERFQPDYPELQRMKVETEAARMSLAAETENLVKGAFSEFQTALSRERSLQAEFNEQKGEAFKMNSSAVLYNGLKVEIQNKKTLLDSLLRRESETGVEARLKGLRTSNIRVVDRARVPVRPSSPNKKRNLILALLLGLAGGIGLAFLFDVLDNSVKTSEDVEHYAGLPTLGLVPKFSLEGMNKAYNYGRRLKSGREPVQLAAAAGAAGEGGGASGPAAPIVGEVERAEHPGSIELVPHYFPNSRLAESYRSIRTALLLSSADHPVKTLAVTSALPGEGKTVTTSNLAVTLAQSGKTVVVVDADLRRPRQHRIFKVKNTFGLTTYLTDSVPVKDVIKSTEIPNLFLVNAGPIPPNPAELLGSEKMARFIRMMAEECDYLIFDLPPMLEISDALVLGAKVDGMVLVVQGDKTSREALKKSRERLDLLKVRTLGVVINNVSLPHHGYYYYKDYYHSYHTS